jgi:uncharacterized protein YlxW (UPF0749 family)
MRDAREFAQDLVKIYEAIEQLEEQRKELGESIKMYQSQIKMLTKKAASDQLDLIEEELDSYDWKSAEAIVAGTGLEIESVTIESTHVDAEGKRKTEKVTRKAPRKRRGNGPGLDPSKVQWSDT